MSWSQIEMDSMERTLDTLRSLFNLNGSNLIYGLYQYGSRVYGCATPQSDFDYILVVDKYKDMAEVVFDNININIHELLEFEQKIIGHDIDALECAFLPQKNILINNIPFGNYILNKGKLRRSISEKASHSFVKAKKKLTIEADLDIYVGKKSLFHSLRIINFGIQIAKDGKINDYSAANNYWKEIVENPINDWQYYKDKYQPVYNNLMTEFRKLAPKEIANV